MTSSSPRFQAAITEINARDPRHDIVAGASRPRELVYSERMSERLSQLYPEAAEALGLNLAEPTRRLIDLALLPPRRS